MFPVFPRFGSLGSYGRLCSLAMLRASLRLRAVARAVLDNVEQRSFQSRGKVRRFLARAKGPGNE
jgi:hypothetical protein